MSQGIVQLNGLEATQKLAAKLSELAVAGDIIALEGPIGAGKTTFARYFVAASGYRDEVPSPTFTLVQTYEGERLSIWHFDLYRLQRPEDTFELGMDQAFDEAVSLIEWPERLNGLLPADRLLLRFSHGANDNDREVEIDCGDRWSPRIGGDGFFDGITGGRS